MQAKAKSGCEASSSPMSDIQILLSRLRPDDFVRRRSNGRGNELSVVPSPHYYTRRRFLPDAPIGPTSHLAPTGQRRRRSRATRNRRAKTSGLAIASLVSSLSSLVTCVGWLPGIICGHLAKARIRRIHQPPKEGVSPPPDSYRIFGVAVRSGYHRNLSVAISLPSHETSDVDLVEVQPQTSRPTRSSPPKPNQRPSPTTASP